ncbi:MAG: aminotransferase class V-fold PLP-dependent enzyme [Chlamydiae bacterium]|nr:aminotransferase class V-fold PLP-dependent enzyme [Chlamydiota bacterium]
MQTSIFLDDLDGYHPRADLRKVELSYEPSWRYGGGEEEVVSRAQVAKMLGLADPKDFVPLLGRGVPVQEMLEAHAFQEMFPSGRQQVLTLSTEGSWVDRGMSKWQALGVRHGSIALDRRGQLTAEVLLQHLTPRTSLVSLSWAHPTIATIHPIEEIARICDERGIFCHVDISALIGKMYWDIKSTKIDYVTFEARNFQGFDGVGGIVFQNKAQKPSWLLEQKSPWALQAMVKALEAAEERVDTVHLEGARLKNLLEKLLTQAIPCARVLFQEVERLPHVAVVAFPYVEAEYMLYLLAQEKLYLSMGGGEHKLLSQVLKTAQVDAALAACSIVFALSCDTTEEEVREAVSRVVKVYERVKHLGEDLVHVDTV